MSTRRSSAASEAGALARRVTGPGPSTVAFLHMREHVATPGSAGAGEPWLDAERLDVYRIALEFQALASTLALGRVVQMLTRLCQRLEAMAAAS